MSLTVDENSWSRTGIINRNPPPPLPFLIVPPPSPGGTAYAADRSAEETAGCVDTQFAATQRVEPGSGPRIAFQEGLITGACTWAFQMPYFTSGWTGGRMVGNTYWPST